MKMYIEGFLAHNHNNMTIVFIEGFLIMAMQVHKHGLRRIEIRVFFISVTLYVGPYTKQLITNVSERSLSQIH